MMMTTRDHVTCLQANVTARDWAREVTWVVTRAQMGGHGRGQAGRRRGCERWLPEGRREGGVKGESGREDVQKELKEEGKACAWPCANG
mmetsp:Transcript_29813/g.71663  ORF Transcript_29813/g.71663 Transcript_29813/m.71663 type:complete len:89 (+) Transcript_29813:1626-1892(+)